MRGYVDTSAGQVHYRRDGDSGPTRVLLHCANFSSNLYERAMPLLAERLQVWAFDAPGVGFSDAPPAPTLPQIAGLLLEAFEGLGISQPIVGGLHAGSRIALQMEEVGGSDVFSAAVLMGLGPLSTEYTDAHPPRAAHLHLDPDTQGSAWRNAIERYYEIYPDQNPPTEENGWLQHMYAVSSVSKVVPMRLPWPGAPVEGFGLEQVLRDLAFPILILNTPEDLLVNSDREMATWNPNAELEIIDGIGPHLMLRAPDVYTEAVFKFLERRGLLAGA